MPYLFCFAIAGLLSYTSGRMQRDRWASLFRLLSILPLCILAGVRDTTIGTDVTSYVVTIYNNSLYTGFFDLTYTNFLYGVFTWMISHVFGSFNVYLFCVQLLIVCPVYAYLFRASKKHAWIGITVYNLVFFCYSLNLVRQSIAVSICIYASRYAAENRPLPFLAGSAIAMGFHQTAVMGLLLWPIFMKTQTIGRSLDGKTSFAWRYLTMGIALAILLVVSFGLDALAGLKDSYSYQAEHGGSTSLGAPLFFLLYFAFFHVIRSNRRSSVSEMVFAEKDDLGFGLLFGAIIFLLSYVSTELFRLSFYYLELFPRYSIRVYESEGDSKTRTIFVVALISTCLVFWYWKFVWQNAGAVTPYASALLGI